MYVEGCVNVHHRWQLDIAEVFEKQGASHARSDIPSEEKLRLPEVT